MAGLPAHLVTRANAGAFYFAFCLMRRTCEHARRCGVQVELAVAVGIGARKFKERPGGRVQYVRLLRRRAGRCVFETEVDTNLLEARKCRAQGLSRGAAAAPAVAALLTRGLRT